MLLKFGTKDVYVFTVQCELTSLVRRSAIFTDSIGSKSNR